MDEKKKTKLKLKKETLRAAQEQPRQPWRYSSASPPISVWLTGGYIYNGRRW